MSSPQPALATRASTGAQPLLAPTLRVSFIWRDEVMNDEIVGLGAPVTIGAGPKCMFTTPKLGLPPQFAILRPGARGYVLTLGTGMGGRISLKGVEKEVGDWVARGGEGADGSEGKFRATPIAPGDWGVIELDRSGDYRLFFKFEKPPPPVGAGLQRLAETLLWMAPAIAFALLMHGVLLTMAYLLKPDSNAFVFPGSGNLMTAYEVKVPADEVKPEPEKKKDKLTAGMEKAKKFEKEPAATMDKMGKAGGEGKVRSSAPDPKKGKPKAPEIAFLKKENIAELEKVAELGAMDKDFGRTLARLKRKNYMAGDMGAGGGTGTGAGDDKDGTGTTRGAEKGGSGGGGKASHDVITHKDMKTGGERAGKGSGGRSPRPVMVAKGASGSFEGGLTKADVDKVIKRYARQIRACYQAEIQRSPNLSGKVVVRFRIRDRGGKGIVTQASVVKGKSTIGNSKVESCVKRKIERLTFPAKGGANVNYPFIFSMG